MQRETLWNWIFQVFKCKNEIGAQRVDENLGSSGENVYGDLKDPI